MKLTSLLFSLSTLPCLAIASVTIDVVVAYDDTHRKHWGDDGILVEAESVLNFTEGVFFNGSMDVTFRIVHIFHEPGYTTMGEAFEHFYSSRFKYTSAFGADLFIFLAENGWMNGKGQATLPGNYCFANLAYFRTGHTGWVVAHEIGHTFGAGHDVGFGEGLHPYAHAFPCETEGALLWTAVGDGSHGSRSRVPYFSDPESSWEGEPLGVPGMLTGGYPNEFGADNRSTIDGYLDTAAGRESPERFFWRESIVLPNAMHSLDWFGEFNLSQWHKRTKNASGFGRYILHEHLQWCWVPLNSTRESIWLWSHRYNAWVFVDEGLHRMGWVSGSSNGWISW